MADTTPTRQQQGSQRFFRLTPEIAEKLRAANLTASEWRLWSLLATLDPFGDRYIEAPDFLELLSLAQIKKSSYYRALAKFEDLGIVDVQPVKTMFRNLLGSKSTSPENSPKFGNPVPNLGNQSQIWESSPKFGNPVPNLGTDSQNWENGSAELPQGKDSRSPQTLKTSQTSTDSLKGSSQDERDPQGDDPDFREWLTRKASKLPNPPQLLDQWIEKQSLLKSNQSQFLKERREDLKARCADQPPDRLSVELSCSSAITQGDRSFVVSKLNGLWDLGWHDLVESLCRDFPAWGVAVAGQGVREIDK